MARLGDHPHIVTVHDIGEENGEPFIVSQYMAGGALARLLADAPGGRLPVDDVVSIATAMAGALEHAHAKGVVHRDLKPANIWLSEDGTAKLGDFGLAFSMERASVTHSGRIVGTVAYMAPEQALGRKPDAGGDLYSLGAVMYEMVSGRPPFAGDDVVSVISQHAYADPVAPSWHAPDLPPDLERLILDLLAKSPADRPHGATAVLRRLEEVSAAIAAQAAAGEPGARIAADPLGALAEGIFVGRESEIDRLREGVEGALAGHGGLMMLVGEPGIGKTRTAQEVATYAAVRGARVLVGRCYEVEGAPAYWPWVQAARGYIEDRDARQVAREMGAGAADIARVMSELRELIPGVVAPESLDPDQARFRFFDSVTTFLKNAARAQPIVLVLDDLHWADAPSLLMLQFLARELADSSLFVLGTYRDVELGRRHPLSQALGEMAREGVVERVLLRGLGEREVARFVEMTASIKPSPALVRAVHEETEGNPFFVTEVVNLLASEGGLEGDAGEAIRVAIPQGVREVVGRRLDRLSEECNALLAVASVIGREFGVDVLERAAQLPHELVLELLEEADAARIVGEVGKGRMQRYSFSHALVREALYDELGVTHRVRLHRRIAEVIVDICGDDPEPRLAELAYHFLQAQDLDPAIEYAVRAGERAVQQMAYEDGAELFENALEALETREPAAGAQHCGLMLALASARMRAGDSGRAQESFWRAARLARTLGDVAMLAEAAEGLAGLGEIGVVDRPLIALIEEALEGLSADDSSLRARLLARLSMAVYFESPKRRGELASEAIAMARRVGDPITLAAVLNDSHFAVWGLEVEPRLEMSTELVEVAERVGDRELAVEGRGLRLVDLLETGDMEAVDRELATYAAGAKELRQPKYLRYAAVRSAMRSMLAGRFEQAERILEKESERARFGLEPNTLQAFSVVMFELRRQQGRLAEVEQEFSRYAGQYPAVPAWRAALGALYMELGRVEDARREYEFLAKDDFAALPRDANWLVGETLVAEVAAWLGDRDGAARLYERLLPYADRNIVVGGGWGCYGSVSRFLGYLATTLERWDDAERHFEDAIAMHERLATPPFIALARFGLARLLFLRGGEADGRRADALVGQVLDTAREIGMGALVERAFALRLEIQGIDSADVRSSIDAVAEAVEDERPDLRRASAPDGTVTIVFSDIERSTEMNERLGDRRWLEVLRAHNALVRAQVRAHGGFEVKSQGDGFMLAFASPQGAVACAVAIQRALAASEDVPDAPVRVRMGLHTGEAIRERDDFFGRNVVLAARIAAEADGGEILVSSLVRELVGADAEIVFGDGREVELKGLAGVHRVHSVDWPEAASAGPMRDLGLSRS
jgi:class 3 adenylate cyclase